MMVSCKFNSHWRQLYFCYNLIKSIDINFVQKCQICENLDCTRSWQESFPFHFSHVHHRYSSGSRGGPRGPCPPSVPDKDYLLCTSWHFLVKNPLDQLNNEFYGPYLYFFKKIFSLASLGMNIILLSYSSGLTLLIISFIFYFLMCILLHYNNSSHNLSCL